MLSSIKTQGLFQETEEWTNILIELTTSSVEVGLLNTSGGFGHLCWCYENLSNYDLSNIRFIKFPVPKGVRGSG